MAGKHNEEADGDLYSKESRENLLDDEVISNEEDGFMEGYDQGLEMREDGEIEFEEEEIYNVT